MKNIIIGLVVVIVLIGAVVGFLIFNINSVVKSGVEVVGSEVLGVAVTVDKVNVSIFSGQGSIQGLAVANPDGYDAPHAITVDEVSVSLDPGSIGSDKIHINEIVVKRPSITYEGNLIDSNIKQLQEAAENSTGGGDDDASDAGETTQLQIDRLLLNDATVGVHLSFLSETLALTLPSLKLNDLGQDEGTTVADVANEVLIALNKSLVPLIKENAGSITDKLKEASEKITDKVSDKLKGLFKR